jgi:hypothetical protein
LAADQRGSTRIEPRVRQIYPRISALIRGNDYSCSGTPDIAAMNDKAAGNRGFFYEADLGPTPIG